MIMCAACDTGRDADMRGSADTATASAPASAVSAEWPAGEGSVAVSREREADLTGDGIAEAVLVTAAGPTYDSLAVTLVIRSAGGDTLWADGWSSSHYFKYVHADSMSRDDVRRTVQAHVDSLLADDRFGESGLPARLRESPRDMQREAVHYHLAELDWRNGASLMPADPTPPSAHDRIEPRHVVPERVDAVLRELDTKPSFWYYAGGEAVYAIGWSERENGFVRLYSCC
jgi:hypothetical protein